MRSVSPVANCVQHVSFHLVVFAQCIGSEKKTKGKQTVLWVKATPYFVPKADSQNATNDGPRKSAIGFTKQREHEKED